MKQMLQKGFTLIELVVVIVILGILAAVAVPQFIDTSASARTAVGQSACGALQSTAVMYYASNKAASSLSAMIAGTNSASSGFQLAGAACNTVSAYVPTQASPGAGGTVACAAIPAALCTTP
jgi:MSHA pilin protein MshA